MATIPSAHFSSSTSSQTAAGILANGSLNVARSFKLEQVIPQALQSSPLSTLKSAFSQDSFNSVSDTSRQAAQELVQAGTKGTIYGGILGLLASIPIGFQLISTNHPWRNFFAAWSGITVLSATLMVTQALSKQVNQLKLAMNGQ